MWLTFGKKHVGSWWMTMLMLLAMLSAFSCAAVNGWQYDSDPSVILSEGDNCRTKSGEAGICRRIDACPAYDEGLRKKTIQYSSLFRCSFVGVTEVICCPEPGTPPVTPTTGRNTGWGVLVERAMTTSSTTTTTTMRPIVIGNITITGNEQFIDLSKVLSRPSTTTTTRRPQQRGFQPLPSINMAPHPVDGNSNMGVLNPWQWQDPRRQPSEPRLPGNNVQWQDPQRQPWELRLPGNNVQWQDPRRQPFNLPTDPRHVVRFPTTTTTTRRPQRIRPDPDAEWFIPLSANGGQGPTSGKVVQFPLQTTSTPPINTQNTKPIAVFTDPFAPFQFRPGADDPILVGTSTIATLVHNSLDDDSENEWAWSSENRETAVLTTSTTTTPRLPTTSTTTTTTTPTTPTLTPGSVLDEWMIAALKNATTPSPRIVTVVPSPAIDVVPLSV